MMLSLGQFLFGMDTLAFQELRRRTSWRHAESARVGARPASQFAGAGADTVSLPGWIGPELCGDPASLDQLRAMGDDGSSYTLAAGTGEILGEYVITDLDQTSSVLFADGTPRKVEFALELKRVDDAPPAPEGDPADWDIAL